MHLTKQKGTHGCREQTSGYQWGEERGESFKTEYLKKLRTFHKDKRTIQQED